MQLPTVLLTLAAALSVTAHPSGHAHLHRSVHEKRVPAFYKAIHHSKIDKPLPTTTAEPAAPAAPTATVEASPAAATDSAAAAYKPFCQGLSKRASAADIASKGNTGVEGHYACNIMPVDHSIAHKYKYTTVYTNVDDKEYEVICSLKIGPTGLIDGFWHAPVSFKLAPGESQTVAYDENTQGFCAFAPGSVPKTSFGEYAGSWVEYDFGSERNNKWSGADCSSLVAVSENMDIPGCQVCDSSVCSTIYPGGAGDNAFTAGTADKDGLGLNIPAGPVQLNVKVGYSK